MRRETFHSIMGITWFIFGIIAYGLSKDVSWVQTGLILAGIWTASANKE